MANADSLCYNEAEHKHTNHGIPLNRSRPHLTSLSASFSSLFFSILCFFRAIDSGGKVSGLRPLGYTLLGYAFAAPMSASIALTNTLLITAVLLFFGAYGNFWDWRLQGERNATALVIRRCRFSAEHALALSCTPWLLIFAVGIPVVRAGLSSQAVLLLAVIAAIGIAYITPGLRLKVRRGGFLWTPWVACLLFLQAYGVQGKPLMVPWVLVLCALLWLFQFQAELLHLLDDRLHDPREPHRLSMPQLTRWLRRLPAIAFWVSVAALWISPWFLNTACWSLWRLWSLRRASVERLTMIRRKLWHPVWSLQEFAVYGLLGIWGAAAGWLMPPVVAAPQPTTLAQQARAAFDAGAEYLARVQQPHGAFLADQCEDAAMSRCVRKELPMASAVVLDGLAQLPQGIERRVTQRAARYLRAQQTEGGWLRYHAWAHPTALRELPVVADSSYAAWVLDRVGMDGASSWQRSLLAQQRSDGSFPIYRFPDGWSSPASVHLLPALWHGQPVMSRLSETDPLTDATVLFWLSHHGVSAGPLCGRVAQAAQASEAAWGSSFGDSPYMFINVVGRTYPAAASCLAPARTALLARLTQDQQDAEGVLESAWVAGALMGLGYAGEAVDRRVAWLLKQQGPDGSWPSAPVWRAEEGKAWVGSPAMSTGVVLQTLGRYARLYELDEPVERAQHATIGE